MAGVGVAECYEMLIGAMSVEIRQSVLRNDNAAVMRRVAAGESFVVTVNGRRSPMSCPIGGVVADAVSWQ